LQYSGILQLPQIQQKNFSFKKNSFASGRVFDFQKPAVVVVATFIFCVIEEELHLHFDYCVLGCFSLLGFVLVAD
jgi:hypothetical protein